MSNPKPTTSKSDCSARCDLINQIYPGTEDESWYCRTHSRPYYPNRKPTTSELYDMPIYITFGFFCPIHRYHEKTVAIEKRPKANAAITMTQCTNEFPDVPIYETRLYGNLRLVTEIKEKK